MTDHSPTAEPAAELAAGVERALARLEELDLAEHPEVYERLDAEILAELRRLESL